MCLYLRNYHVSVMHDLKFWSWGGLDLSMPKMLSINLYYILEAVIGFRRESYSVSETDETVSIQFGVLTGSLGTTISVNLSLSDGTALCKLLSTKCLIRTFILSGFLSSP